MSELAPRPLMMKRSSLEPWRARSVTSTTSHIHDVDEPSSLTSSSRADGLSESASPPPSKSKSKAPPPPRLARANTAPLPASGPKGPPPPPPPRSLTRSSCDDSGHFLKLKPLYWVKVPADPLLSMVWDKVRAGSFQLDEVGIATRFKAAPDVKTDVVKSTGQVPACVKLIDPKKAHIMGIQLRALKVSTQAICDAVLKGEGLKPELLEALVKMSPTEEERKALLNFSGNLGELGPAELFLKSILNIPFAFRRLEAMRFKTCFNDDVSRVREKLQLLENACVQVIDNLLFLKILEAVLKIGNHMNRGTNRGEAKAFKLDTLLKLADVKSVDGKTTLMHFVVEEIIKAEGLLIIMQEKGKDSRHTRSSEECVKRKGMEAVLRMFCELEHVKKAAEIDTDALSTSVLEIANGLSLIQSRLKDSFENLDGGGSLMEDSFQANIEVFSIQAEQDVEALKLEQARVFDLVNKSTAYFHGNQRETQPLRLLLIVRDFLSMLEKACVDVAKPLKMPVFRH